MDALPIPGAATQRCHGFGQRRSQLLRLGGSVRYVRAGQECADRHRQWRGCLDGAIEWQMGGAPSALSNRVLRKGIGWTNRRSENRLEGQRTVVDLATRAVFHGGRR